VFQSGYDAMPDKELKQRVRCDLYLLLLRAMAMFIMAAHRLAFILVPLMALLLSYFEIWPERALAAVLRRSVEAVRIRSRQSCVEPAPTLMPPAALRPGEQPLGKAATSDGYFAIPTILRTCFFCSIASSMNAATALRDSVKPILGAAPSRLR
jgi:hypothetical protein